MKKAKEVTLTSFTIIQKTRSHPIKSKGPPLTTQGMKEGYLQGRILHQVKAILTSIKQSFLVIAFIVKTLVIKLSIAKLIRIIFQDIRSIIKASHIA